MLYITSIMTDNQVRPLTTTYATTSIEFFESLHTTFKCESLIEILVEGTEKMNILRMVLGVKKTISLVWDLEQHCCSMDLAHKLHVQIPVVSQVHIFYFSLSLFESSLGRVSLVSLSEISLSIFLTASSIFFSGISGSGPDSI